jgi:hypothetical protein
LTPFTGALVDRFGERLPIIIGLLLLAARSAWLALIAEPGLAYAAMIAPLILAGAGTVLAMPAAQKAVVGRGRAGRDRHGVGHLHHHALARRRVRSRDRRRRVRHRRRLRLARAVQRRIRRCHGRLSRPLTRRRDRRHRASESTTDR